MPSVIINDLLTESLQEINAVSDGQAAPPQWIMARALGTLVQIVDLWNAQRQMIYYESFLPFTLTPNLNPHTIGPTGATWTVATERPVSIEGIVINVAASGQPTNVIVRQKDAVWWQSVTTPEMASPIPTYFYYDPTETNGSIYFWGVPNTAYEVQVRIRGLLGTPTQFATVVFPQGYHAALKYTLSEWLSGPLRKPFTTAQKQLASEARAAIAANNITVPQVASMDPGMPHTTSRGNLSTWNWLSGLPASFNSGR